MYRLQVQPRSKNVGRLVHLERGKRSEREPPPSPEVCNTSYFFCTRSFSPALEASNRVTPCMYVGRRDGRARSAPAPRGQRALARLPNFGLVVVEAAALLQRKRLLA